MVQIFHRKGLLEFNIRKTHKQAILIVANKSLKETILKEQDGDIKMGLYLTIYCERNET